MKDGPLSNPNGQEKSIVLICPGERSAVHALAQSAPLALVPILGKTLLEHWLDHLADSGVRHVRLLVSERPEQVRAWLGDGVRWELKVELVADDRELTTAEARAKYSSNESSDPGVKQGDVTVMDFLPGAPERPLFRSYADWFIAVKNSLPQAASAPDRIGVRKLKPGVWAGLHSRISADAELRAPCWIGENVLVGPRAIIGPNAIVEDGTVLAADAEVTDSFVGPETYVGEFTEVKRSLALGSTLINWQTSSCTHVPDAFLLSPLSQRAATARADHWLGRVTAAAVLLLTLPLACYALLKAWSRGQRALHPLVAVRPETGTISASRAVLTYYEFTTAADWLKRWPQLWNVVRGEFAWVGNRPISPEAAATLASDFERLWLKTPIGLFSLADAEAGGPAFSQEARVLASLYAVRANRRLDLSILVRVLGFWLVKRISFGNRL